MKVDLILRNAEVYNVYLNRWLNRDVAVLEDRVFFVGDTEKADIESPTTLDCRGKPLIPGFIDIHLHIESSYCLPAEFGRAVLPRGVTTVVSEPHEMANVFGSSGVEEMIRLSRGCPIDIFYGVPSSVPSTSSDLETTGGTITAEDALALFEDYPDIICVGEIMSFASIVDGDAEGTRSFLTPLRRRNVLPAVEGHIPDIVGVDLARVLYEGIDSDHCLQSPDSLYERFEQGVFVEIQEKSLTREIVNILKEPSHRGLYSFVTDDVAPDILYRQGHLDGVIRKAMRLGLPLEDAIIASSRAPSQRMGFRDRGAVAPGKKADLILLSDKSAELPIHKVFKNGVEYFPEKQQDTIAVEVRFKDSISLPDDLDTGNFFRLPTEPSDEVESLVARSIVKNSGNSYTEEGRIRLNVKNNLVDWENQECNLIVVVDRYTGSAAFSQGILQGEYLHGGAIATSHAHDSHNILIAGDNSKDMESAFGWVRENRGGICIFRNGKLTAGTALPIGGILSEQALDRLSEDMTAISDAMKDMGYRHPNPIMSFSTLTLPVSPELKITDKGLVRTKTRELLPLFPGD